MVVGNHGRGLATAVFTPVARVLAKMKVTPNMVTLTSSALVLVVAFGVLARGHLVAGAIALTVLMVADSLDGVLARETGLSSPFGAFLDSTMDRITDGAAVGSVLWWVIMGADPSVERNVAIGAGLAAVVLSGVVPYARARAESLGVIAKMGIAERTDRLVVIGLGTLLTGFGLTLWPILIAFLWVAFASAVTVFQRVLFTYKSLKSEEAK